MLSRSPMYLSWFVDVIVVFYTSEALTHFIENENLKLGPGSLSSYPSYLRPQLLVFEASHGASAASR